MTSQRVPAGQPGTGRPARPPLSTEQVLTTALQILDTEGLQALTMRRLGQALDRKPMTLYRYAADKAALLDGVVALVLSDLAIDPGAADWREELRGVAVRFRHLALAHPNVVPLLITGPPATPLGKRPPGALRPLENLLELLIRAGFTPGDALQSYRLFFGFLHGHILDELQNLIEDPDEADDLLRLGLQRLPRSDFPRLRALAPELASYDGAASLQQGTDMMITGLQARFQPHAPLPGNSQPGTPGQQATAR